MPTDVLIPPAPRGTSASRPVDCWHCASPVLETFRGTAGEPQFCCAGCRAAYGVIHESGLDEYYSLRRELDGRARPAAAAPSSYEEMDDPVYHALHVRSQNDGTSTTRLLLQGVHCAACLWLVERLPVILPGVLSARLNLTRATVDIHWRHTQLKLSTIAQSLDRLGYAPYPLAESSKAEAARREDRKQLARLAVAGACAGNNMLLALALYAGSFTGMAAEQVQLFRGASALLGVLSLVWPGSVFFRGAWSALRARTTHLDVPLALGLGAGGIAGVVNTVRGVGDVYFDSLSVLVFFLLVGRWVQYRQQRRAVDSVAMLRSLTPRRTTRLIDGQPRTIPVEAIGLDDRILVRVGDVLPADGVVVDGQSTVDEAILTGESIGRAVAVGSFVLAGTTNQSAPLEMRVTAIGTDTRAGKLMQTVEDASLGRAPIVALANRISGVFVVTAAILSIVTAAYWYSVGSSRWLEHAIALLVVSCPCSLGLATPLAIAVAQGRAARQSILVKGGEAIECLARPTRIWLDKTGTLTEGRMELRCWHGSQSALTIAAAVEGRANHPIAQAIRGAAMRGEVSRLEVKGFRQTLGAGVAAVVDGRRVLVGSPDYLRGTGISWTIEDAGRIEDVLRQGLTVVLVAMDGKLEAIAGVGDRLRSDSAAAVSDLVRRGCVVGILSGDHPTIVAKVAREVGIPNTAAHGGLSPEDKLRIVQESVRQGAVVMVGDGVNDSGALAAATVGVAVKGGAEASLHAAQVYLAAGGLRPLIDLMDGSRRTVRVIHANFAVSLTYNVLAIGLAMAGGINPLVAAVLMPASSLAVVALSMTSYTFGSRR